jgi:hypothetical protein
MDKNIFVYCTNCKNIEKNLKCIKYVKGAIAIEYCKKCVCNDCDCFNREDSMKFEKRPNYIKG